MLAVLENLVPVILVIATGWATRATKFVSDQEWTAIERVTYYFFVPALMMTTLATADLAKVPVGLISFVLFVPNAVVTLVAVFMRKPLHSMLAVDGPAFTSVFQGAVRWNTFVALGLVIAVYGRTGLAICAVAFAVLVPFVNLTSTVILARYGARTHAFSSGAFLLSLIKNPFVWSSLAGTALNVSGLPIPKVVLTYGDILARATLATGLLMVGAGLDLQRLRKPDGGMLASSILKLLLLPLLTGLLGMWIGLSGVTLAVPVICAASPTATSAYIMARRNGGDAPLMAAITTFQTIVAALTLPLMLWLFVT